MVSSEHPSGRPSMRAIVVVAVLAAALSGVLALAQVPSAVLFGGLLAGIVHALTGRTELVLPTTAFRLGQAIVGAIIGAQISADALREMGRAALPITAVTLGTVVVSVLGGLLLARRRDVSLVTGVCAMIAGGASGVVAIARDLGADDRVVTVVQYLRVAVVLLTLPVITAVVFDPPSGMGELSRPDVAWPSAVAYLLITVLAGLVAARLVRVTTSVLLVPIVVGAVISSAGWLGDVAVPEPVQWLAYVLIGVQVGLRFTRDSLRSITRMLPAVLAIIVGLIVVTGLMAVLLARYTSVDGLTAYLATTPGGLFAVLATAADAGADVTYVTAVQLFRLLVILAIIPLVAGWLRRRA